MKARYVGAALCVAAVLCVAAEALAGEKPWIVSFYLNQGNWSANGVDHQGRQSIASTQLVYKKNDWGVAVTESYTSTSYNTSLSNDNFEVDTPTDVSISSYYIKKLNKITLRGGLDISLGTGTNQYKTSELQSMIIDDINEDLMLINNYGSGLNFRPHILAAYDAGPMTWGAGANYLLSGAFDPISDDNSGDEYNQGDKFTLFLSNLYKLSNKNFTLVTLSYSNWQTDTFGKQDLFSNGDKYQIKGRWVSEWAPLFRGTVGVQYSWQDKNKTFEGEDVFVTEKSNANGNEIEIFLDGLYSLTNSLSPTFILGYKQVENNGYASGEALYDAGRSLTYLEPGLIWYHGKDMYVVGKLRYSRIEDKADAFSVNNATYDVINMDIGLVLTF